jgi:glutaredoxin
MTSIYDNISPSSRARRPTRSLIAPFVPTPRIGDNQSMQLFVYSANWCRDCREAKRFLATHSIPYTEIDIEKTPGAAEQVIANTGKRAIPQFVLDGKWDPALQARPGLSPR